MRLIDADALKQTFCAECNHSIKCDDCDIDYHFNHAPTVEPKHGHWKMIPQYGAECSECGLAMFAIMGVPYTSFKPNYCPCCGAKMDEENV